MTRNVRFFLPALFLFACSGSTDGAGVSNPFVGTWRCTGTSTTTYTTPAGMPASTQPSSSTVTIVDDGDGRITTLRLPDNGAPECTLHARLDADGRSTTLDGNQTCTSLNGGTVAYTSGETRIASATTYTASHTWSYAGTTAKGAPLVGTGSGASTCTKQ